MGTSNAVTKEYVKDNRVFADICNYCIYDGRQVIKPEELVERDVAELGIFTDDKGMEALERLRDVLKLVAVKQYGRTAYAIIGIENQTNTDYAMVVRSMVNDALNYDAQVKRLIKEHKKAKDLQGNEYISGITAADKLIPVVTIVVFWNADEWSGARCLYDMLDVDDNELLKFVNNYKLNLVVPREIADFGKFSTDFGIVMECISCAEDEAAMQRFYDRASEEKLLISNEAAKVLNVCINAKLEMECNAEGGKVNMCRAMDALVAKGELRGEARGIVQGEARKLVQMIERFMNKNNLMLDVACDMLDVSVEEYCSAKELITAYK